MSRQISFSKEQREYARKLQNGRLYAIAWEDQDGISHLTGPANEKQLRYIKRAYNHVLKLGGSVEEE